MSTVTPPIEADLITLEELLERLGGIPAERVRLRHPLGSATEPSLARKGEAIFFDGKMGVDADGSPLSKRNPGITDQPETSFRYPSPGRPSVDSDKAVAEFKNGILKLRLPKSEASRPKQIKVNVDGEKTLEAKGSSKFAVASGQ